MNGNAGVVRSYWKILSVRTTNELRRVADAVGDRGQLDTLVGVDQGHTGLHGAALCVRADHGDDLLQLLADLVRSRSFVDATRTAIQAEYELDNTNIDQT